MAESTAPPESQQHSPVPVARPRRNRSKSAIQYSSSEQGSHDDRSLQENTKPQRPSVPPRPNFSELKKFATRTHSGSTVHSQASTSSSANQRQISTENHAKSPGSPRLAGSSSANALLRIHQRKSEQLQRIRSKSSSESVDSRCSNGTLKQRQNLCSNRVSTDSGVQGNRSTKPSSAVRVSHSQSFSSPERKRGANATTSTGQTNAQQQSPTRPKPPLPANRPSLAPSTASGKGSPTRQNQRPSRPPTLPKTAAVLNTSKVPLSHLYGSTQSLPAAMEGSRKVATTLKCFDDNSVSTKLNGSLAAKSGRRLKVSPSKGPQYSYRTLPKDYGRKSTTQESPNQSQNRRTSDMPRAQREKVPPASNSTTAGTSTKHVSGSKDKNSRSATLPRKTQPQHSKIPPKRPPCPPVVRDKPRPVGVTRAPQTPPSVDDSVRYTTFPNHQVQQQQQQPIEDHIYMEVGQMPSQQTNNISSWPTEGGGAAAEYPYVIMSRADSVHIYTPLALDTTDDAEGEIIHVYGLVY